jgi:peptide/nickel transport system substrate-binding protein
MQFRLFKLRLRRRIRHGQHQVADIGAYTEAGLERHLFRRLSNLNKVWRFIAAWLLLVIILVGGMIVQITRLGHYYQTLQPVAGGIYSEGVLGNFTNANPIYATSEVDTTVSRLVFAGLLTYDEKNRLTGDLARSWEADATGTLYTVHLKPNLTWHDGKPLTADDVVFTFKAIQNPDAQSPLAGSWQGVTVTKKDAYTVLFQLTNPLAAFPYSLTTGIIPAKAFQGSPATSWRSLDFNSLHPIGAGPFKWDALQVKGVKREDKEVLIALNPFDKYTLGQPKLSSFVVHAFNDEEALADTFNHKQLSAIVPPESYESQDKAVEHSDFVLTAANMVFFNTAAGVLADAQVRQALVRGTDVSGVQQVLGYPTRPVREPLLKGQVAYDPSVQQFGFDVKAARAGLDKAGWLVGKQGLRYKEGKPLSVKLIASTTREHGKVVEALKKDWQALGVKVVTPVEDTQDFQNALASHAYDAVFYGISIGVDPDVFVYWHSTQTDPRSTRLNLSQYKSATADAALEAGRTRLDPVLRTIKYKPFLQAWQQDAPALGLYQPRFQYLSHETVYGLDAKVLNNGTDRLNNVQNWMVLTSEVTNK